MVSGNIVAHIMVVITIAHKLSEVYDLLKTKCEKLTKHTQKKLEKFFYNGWSEGSKRLP
jgi:hypothetical protein